MRTCLAILGLIALGQHPTPLEDNEANFKDTIKLMSDMTDVLKPVNDKNSAERALPKLKAINERLARLKKRELNTILLPPEENRELFDKHKMPFGAAVLALGLEMARIEKLPDANAELTKEWSLFARTNNTMRMMKEARAAAALIQIKAINKALQAYKLKTGAFPDSLNEMTEGKNSTLKEENIRDPWGKPYQYSLSGERNDGKMPDVWTETPERAIIGNWEKAKP